MRLLFLSIALLICFSATAQKVCFSIWQDGKKQPIKNNKVYLKRAPFLIKLQYNTQKVDMLLLNASISANYFNLGPKDTFPAQPYLQYMIFAEYSFNRDSSIFLSDDSFHGLGKPFMHNNVGEHRFNKLDQKGKKLYGERWVHYLDVPKLEKKTKIEDFQKPLYLCWVAMTKLPNSNDNTATKYSYKHWAAEVLWKE